MTYRRSPGKHAASSEWARFVEANRHVISATGMPALVTSSIDHFDDFLSHGALNRHPDPGTFNVESLSPEQYAALVTLAESYFAAGYEWFTPLALKEDDQYRLRSRFET